MSAKESNSQRLLLGFDNFSIRALGWKAPRLIEYASKHKVDALLFSDLDVYESHDIGYLREIGQEVKKQKSFYMPAQAGYARLPKSFKDKHGTAEEHLRLLIKVAKGVGASVARCYLDHQRTEKRRVESADIWMHHSNSQESPKQALDAGVKIAVENHAGDMHSRELVELIEQAGPEFVGATIDTGNSTWTLEDPLETFRNLAPYAVCSGIRDSMVWQSHKGAKVQWTAMGDGCVDMKTLFQEWSNACPETPVQIETISGFARNSLISKRFLAPLLHYTMPMIIHAFSLYQGKEKHYLPFPHLRGRIRKKPSRNTNWQSWKKAFPTAGKVWGWEESLPKRRPVNQDLPDGQHHPNLPDSIRIQFFPVG